MGLLQNNYQSWFYQPVKCAQRGGKKNSFNILKKKIYNVLRKVPKLGNIFVQSILFSSKNK